MKSLCPRGRKMALFFYDGPISRGPWRFEKLLDSGETVRHNVWSQGSLTNVSARKLMHIATDGESYGHHHRHGDMALAYALRYVRRKKASARLTNYGEFLEKHPSEA